MKKYKTLEIHVKEATINEKADAVITESEAYFNKEDVVLITKQTSSIFNRKAIDDLVDKLTKDIPIYKIYLNNKMSVPNVALTSEELAYLCE